MTFEQAQREVEAVFGPEVNPRWIACHAALGRRPAAWEFCIWNSQRWSEFAAHIGVTVGLTWEAARKCCLALGADVADREYNAWLRKHINEGIPDRWRLV